MKLLVISSAPFIEKPDGIYAYSPYVKELEVWSKNVDKINFACPFWKTEKDLLVARIPFNIDGFYRLKEFHFTTFSSAVKAIPIIITNSIILYKSIKESDAIHLRCPGNIGFLACFIQILFPSKIKSAKYAGNWDPKAKQPISYVIQKWILSNTFLTRNCKVLVYGNWENSSKNIKPFFTATYYHSESTDVSPRILEGKINMIFVGMLTKGKQPIYAIKIAEELKNRNFDIQLSLYGGGAEQSNLQEYIDNNNLNYFIFIKGNRDRELIKKVYQKSHFLILPSKSEGWPKVVAEAMFWGCLPIATAVSCVPDIINYGERGVIITEDLDKDAKAIANLITNQESYNNKIFQASNWSRNFTIDKFEEEIKELLRK
jgi:glycosyltransferase involved in cell wall biosynthesis